MIEIRKLKKNYISGETEVKALKGVDLKIDKKDFISIAGPSGSGKTTLLNLIGCLDSPDDGEILYKGELLSKKSKKELSLFRRVSIGFIFQTYNLIPVLSAYENVSFALHLLNFPDKEIKQRTMDILDAVGLKGMENRRPGELSGGQQQRVSIARALVKNPAVILADEPTANLDSATGEDILKLMKTLNKEMETTFIFSTHDQMVMDYADRLVKLHDGEILNEERR